MFARLGKWWRKRQRSIDVQILWPSCKNIAPNLALAKLAFFLHCREDAAWTQDFTEQQLRNYIEDLQ